LYAAYRSCAANDPNRKAALERYNQKIAELSQTDFNGQMPPECLANWIDQKWQNGEHLRLPPE
jgi:hypothetical protein